MEGAGAVHAENEALRWIAELAGLPAGAGGCFVQGGTDGNLSALHAARERARARGGTRPPASPAATRSTPPCALRAVMDAEVLVVPTDADGRLHGVARGTRCATRHVFAVVATAGTTNLGLSTTWRGCPP